MNFRGGGEWRCAIGVGVSVAVVLSCWDCETHQAGLLDVFALMRLPASLVEQVSQSTHFGVTPRDFWRETGPHANSDPQNYPSSFQHDIWGVAGNRDDRWCHVT